MAINLIANIKGYVEKELKYRISNVKSVFSNGSSTYGPLSGVFIRIASGVDDGLIIESNPDALQTEYNANNGLLDDEFLKRHYGTADGSGYVGYDFNDKEVTAPIIGDVSFRGAPYISSVECDDVSGDGGFSRECRLEIHCATLAQLNVIKKYFFEPGNNVFVDWGMRLNDRSCTKPKLSVDYIAKHINPGEIQKIRESQGGLYDCYLGIIKGGSLKMSPDGYIISIELIAETQLNMFRAADSSKANKETKNTFSEDIISSSKIKSGRDYMRMFNQLPSSFRTVSAQNYIYKIAKSSSILLPVINFDPTTLKTCSENTKGVLENYFGVDNTDELKLKDGSVIKLPSGYSFISDKKYISMAIALNLLNIFSDGDVYAGPIDRNGSIPISGFKNIFSTDPDKLFIPNKNTPFISKLSELNKSGTLPKTTSEYDTIIDTRTGMKFDIFYKNTDFKIIDLNKIYVNFDFFCSVINSPGLYMKDILYMLLNGLSSAVGYMWDFQITEDPSTGKYQIIDKNLANPSTTNYFNFTLFGRDSILRNINFDIKLSGDNMNQIVNTRRSDANSGPGGNTSETTIFGSTLMDRTDDKVFQKVTELRKAGNANAPLSNVPADTAEATSDPGTDPLTGTDLKLFVEDDNSANRDQNRATLISTFTFVPAFWYISGNVNETTLHMTAIDDKILFRARKNNQYNIELGKKENTYSPYLPITLEMTMLGISGIDRFDSFTVTGLPDGYSETHGFFQVKKISHSITPDGWWTTLTSMYRQKTLIENDMQV